MIPAFSSQRLTAALAGMLTGFLVSAAAPLAVAADAPPSAAQAAVDGPTPNGLSDSLLQDLEIPAKPEGAPSRTAKPAEPPVDGAAEVDPLLLEQLGAGEDLGQAAEAPLVTIGRRMRLAERLIGRQVTSEQTQRVQQQIIQDLDRLIEELKKQSQSGQAGAPSPPKPGAKPEGKSRAGSGENTGASQPAKESTDRIEGTASDREELARRQLLLKQIWGHLPSKIRDQLQSASIEEFLPKYERLIEAYYSRLAEEESR